MIYDAPEQSELDQKEQMDESQPPTDGSERSEDGATSIEPPASPWDLPGQIKIELTHIGVDQVQSAVQPPVHSAGQYPGQSPVEYPVQSPVQSNESANQLEPRKTETALNAEPVVSQDPALTGGQGVNSEPSLDIATPVPAQEAEAPKPITAESVDGIEILVKLAAAGEFDPKNVDIIDVTDKFLKAIAAAPKENLRQSGKILFHASVLLRMKAEALLAEASGELEQTDDFLDFDDNENGLIYDSRRQVVGRQITLEDLERALVRRTNNRQNRQRKVTLDQLITALRQAEKIEKARAEKKPARARIELAGQHEARDVDDLLDLAHDEDIEDTIDRIERLLVEHTKFGDMISLLSLIKMLGAKGDWVDAFLAVLFLSNAGKLTLEQQEFYGPLYLVRAELQQNTSASAS